MRKHSDHTAAPIKATAHDDRHVGSGDNQHGDLAADDSFSQLLAGVFNALRAGATIISRIDERASVIAAELARRARRRRAQFDLFLRDAPEAYVADMALSVKAQQGNTAAVVEIRRLLEPVVIKRIYAYNLGWNEVDLVEMVFDRVWDKLSTYRGQAALRTWGGTLASNALKNWIRSQDAKPEHVRIDSRSEDVRGLAGEWTPDGALDQDEREEQLKSLAGNLSAIAQSVLSPGDWELLQRQIIEGQSYAELSAETGKSLVALRKRRFDAIRKLREAVLARYGDDFLSVVHESLAQV
jgi:RNA polymerase sigma factor (sigma-70 family)